MLITAGLGLHTFQDHRNQGYLSTITARSAATLHRCLYCHAWTSILIWYWT